MRADLADVGSASKNAGLVALNATLTYTPGTAGAKLNNAKSVQDYPWLAKGDGTTDDKAAIQACIDFCRDKQYPVLFPPPAVAYKLLTGLTIYNGSILIGGSNGQFVEAFNQVPTAAKILFAPTAPNSDLFTFAKYGHSDPFIEHVSIQGLYVLGSANARYAFNIQAVIYSTFRDIGVSSFVAGFKCDATIQNRFENIIVKNSSVAPVTYDSTTNVPTSDVWEQCTFFSAPQGPTLQGAVGVRFNNCIIEQMDNYGVDIARDCQNVIFSNTYVEDVPYTNNASGSVFRVGFSGGGGLVASNHLIVNGGTFKGRSAGAVGAWLDCSYSNGVIVNGISHDRFTNVIRTTADTRDRSIVWGGSNGITWTTFANDITKVVGIFPNGVINSGTNAQNARFGVITVDQLGDAAGTGSSLQMGGGGITHTIGAAAAEYPTTDNVWDFGIDSLRWRSVRAGYMRTSSAAVAGAGGTFTLGGTTVTNVGAAGGAAALPATPLGYLVCYVGGNQCKIAYYSA